MQRKGYTLSVDVPALKVSAKRLAYVARKKWVEADATLRDLPARIPETSSRLDSTRVPFRHPSIAGLTALESAAISSNESVPLVDCRHAVRS